jgi:flagellar biogenesis protein FliO
MTPLGRYVLQTVLTLAAVAGLAVLILYAARRVGVGRPSGPLSIAGRLVLDARRSIYLVRVGDLIYVIGASEAGLSKLGELAPDALGNPSDSEPEPAAGFRQVFERLRASARTPSDRGPGENP